MHVMNNDYCYLVTAVRVFNGPLLLKISVIDDFDRFFSYIGTHLMETSWVWSQLLTPHAL